MNRNVILNIHTNNANATWSCGNMDKTKVYIIVEMFLRLDGELMVDHMQLAREKLYQEWFQLLRIIQDVECA